MAAFDRPDLSHRALKSILEGQQVKPPIFLQLFSLMSRTKVDQNGNEISRYWLELSDGQSSYKCLANGPLEELPPYSILKITGYRLHESKDRKIIVVSGIKCMFDGWWFPKKIGNPKEITKEYFEMEALFTDSFEFPKKMPQNIVDIESLQGYALDNWVLRVLVFGKTSVKQVLIDGKFCKCFLLDARDKKKRHVEIYGRIDLREQFYDEICVGWVYRISNASLNKPVNRKTVPPNTKLERLEKAPYFIWLTLDSVVNPERTNVL